MVGYRAFANCTAVLPDPSPSGFRPRIGVRDRLSPERRGGRRGPIPGRSPGHAFIRNRSCRLVPAQSRYEKPELWFGTAH